MHKYWVYRYLVNGTIVYIGQTTRSPERRYCEHVYADDKFRNVDSIDVCEVKNRVEMIVAEALMISLYKPAWNTDYVNDDTLWGTEIASSLQWTPIPIPNVATQQLKRRVRTRKEWLGTLLSNLSSREMSLLSEILVKTNGQKCNASFDTFGMVDGSSRCVRRDIAKSLATKFADNNFPLDIAYDEINDKVLVSCMAIPNTLSVSEINGLSGKYSKIAYYHLSTYADTGVWHVDYKDFAKVLGIPKSYKPRDVRRQVIAPILSECGKHFRNMRYYEQLGAKRTINSLMFVFDPKVVKDVLKQAVKRESQLQQLGDEKWVDKTELILGTSGSTEVTAESGFFNSPLVLPF